MERFAPPASAITLGDEKKMRCLATSGIWNIVRENIYL